VCVLRLDCFCQALQEPLLCSSNQWTAAFQAVRARAQRVHAGDRCTKTILMYALLLAWLHDHHACVRHEAEPHRIEQIFLL
jgi:hypothetical protein